MTAHARRRAVTLLLWAIGVAMLVAPPLGLMDPAAIALVLDPELLALMVGAGLLLVRAQAVTLLRLSRPPSTAQQSDDAGAHQ